MRVLDNFSTGRRTNVAPFISELELFVGDVRSSEAVAGACRGCDFVLHLAAVASVPKSVADPAETNEVNVTGTLNVLRAAVECGVKRVVYASSCAVYGGASPTPRHERMLPNPGSPYAVSKLAAEHYCRVTTELHGLSTVALRYFNVFGPRQDPRGDYAAVIPKFLTAIMTGGRPVVFGDGRQTRDFVPVADVVRASLAACEADVGGFLLSNVGSGKRRSVRSVLRRLGRALDRKVEPVFAAARPGDIRHSVAAIRVLTEWLATEGLRVWPLVPFDEGIVTMAESG